MAADLPTEEGRCPTCKQATPWSARFPIGRVSATPAAPAIVTEAQRENAVRAVRIQFGERSASPEEVVDMVIAALAAGASAAPKDEQ